LKTHGEFTADWHRPLGRHERWDQGAFYQKELLRHRAQSYSQANAYSRTMTGILATAIAMTAIFVAATVLQREASLLQQPQPRSLQR
jgi:hypothetical protein